MRAIFLILFLFSVTIFGSEESGSDPYSTLSISRSASPQEVRRAYKELAKEWHPDKNPHPNAQSRFVQINKAYELLSDPERRRMFDQHGIQEENFNKEDGGSYRNFESFDGILKFTTGGSFHFPFSDAIQFLHKQSITSKTFDQSVVPKSNTIPQLILFYEDFCPSCARAAPAWRILTEELNGIGMDVLCVHGEREKVVSRRLGISTVPAVVLLIEGHPHHYRDPIISPSKVISFIRSKLPLDLFERVESGNLNEFLSSWEDNRVRILIFGLGTSPRLRYSLLSFHYRDRAAFGYVLPSDFEVRTRFSLPFEMESVLIFKEVSSSPVASLSMPQIPTELLKDLVETNKFLILPRLSSQNLMESICPTESSIYRRRLCVLYMESGLNREDYSSFAKKELYEFVRKWTNSRVRFAYFYQERQREFLNALTSRGEKRDGGNLVVLWRKGGREGAIEWIEWDGSNSSSIKLELLLNSLLSHKEQLPHSVTLNELSDEDASSVLSRVFKKLTLTLEFFRGHLTRDTVIQAASLVATLLFVIAGGFIMAYLVRLEEESIEAKRRSVNSSSTTPSRNIGNNTTPPPPPTSSSSINQERTSSTSGNNGPTSSRWSELRVHEMRGETYNGLVKLIKPGCRTLVLLLDSDTKNSLLPKFQKAVWPYRKNKSLQFGFMDVEKGGGLSWYKELLLLSLTTHRNLNINPRNCVGTVLCLNGYRRYFSVFHATLPPSSLKNRSRSSANGGYRNGGFLGYESEGSTDEDNSDVESRRQELTTETHPSILFTSHLLDNLSNWLDRLFEGSTHRYHINYWPDFPVK